jgi:hypothetical protein
MTSKPCALILALAVLAGGCKTKFGTNTDSATGMSITNKGLSYGEAEVNLDGERLKSNEVLLGRKLVLVYTDVKGSRSRKARYFPARPWS